jgi:hypothetical protein
VLTAQFDAERAGELVALEQWYEEQRKIFVGNSDALDALQKIFGDRWKSIVEGIGGGVDGTLGELERLRKSIADFLKGLTVGNLSPLKPLEKLAEAESQFNAQLRLAQGGDKTALGDITQFADQYLNIARDLFKSSEDYTDIFNRVRESLAGLAGTDLNGAPLSGFDFASVAPTEGRMASSSDLQSLGDRIEAAIGALANANSQDSAQVADVLQEVKTALRIETLK